VIYCSFSGDSVNFSIRRQFFFQLSGAAGKTRGADRGAGQIENLAK
jgi:hypothetical protein